MHNTLPTNTIVLAMPLFLMSPYVTIIIIIMVVEFKEFSGEATQLFRDSIVYTTSQESKRLIFLATVATKGCI